MVQWAYLKSFYFILPTALGFMLQKPSVYCHIELSIIHGGERQDRGRLPSQRMKCASKQVVDGFFSPFGFIIVFKLGPQKGEIAQRSTVFSIFSQMDSWLFTLCYETLSHYWFAFTVTIKRLTVTIGFIQQVVSFPMKGIQVFITHSQQSMNIYFKKNKKRCFIYFFTRYLGPLMLLIQEKKKGETYLF